MHPTGLDLDVEQNEEASEEHGIDGDEAQARMPEAWADKNSLQLKPARLGAGSIPSRRKISHTVLGATLIPRCFSSPWMRR